MNKEYIVSESDLWELYTNALPEGMLSELQIEQNFKEWLKSKQPVQKLDRKAVEEAINNFIGEDLEGNLEIEHDDIGFQKIVNEILALVPEQRVDEDRVREILKDYTIEVKNLNAETLFIGIASNRIPEIANAICNLEGDKK